MDKRCKTCNAWTPPKKGTGYGQCGRWMPEGQGSDIQGCDAGFGCIHHVPEESGQEKMESEA